MKVQVIMSDSDYQRIISASGKRVRGSMAMNSPQEFDFRANASSASQTPPKPNRVLNLKHGRATVASDRMRLCIVVRPKEEPHPVEIICSETDQAVDFFAAN